MRVYQRPSSWNLRAGMSLVRPGGARQNHPAVRLLHHPLPPVPQPASSGEAVATVKRLDLQGVRAIAVLLVVLNHARVPFLRGGYVGVDVFFVLSGYFITGLLIRDGFGSGATVGRISLGRFYARRARRILPAACLTILVTSIAVYVVYDLYGADFLATKPVLEDGLAASLFFANVHFISTANNYFAQASMTMPSPFQHFWSLSVEEQFYVAWPALLLVIFAGCRLRRSRGQHDGEAQRRMATWLIGALVVVGSIVSFVWSIRDTAHNPQVAYFATPVRVWEFGCGAGLALIATRLDGARLARPPQVLRALLGWVGVAMIAVAAVCYSSHTGFPGDAALLPVLGTGLVVLAGMTPVRGGVDRLLAIPPMTYIGDRSYTFYLWHYPVLILAWEAAGRVLPTATNLALLAGAFVISIATYACYENPLRSARWLEGWRTALMAPAAMTLAVLAVLVPTAAFDSSLAASASAAQRTRVRKPAPATNQPRPTSLTNSTPIPTVEAAVRSVQRNASLPAGIVPSLQELERENSHISYTGRPGCTPAFGPGRTSQICRLGDSASKRVVAVVGDSHAGMWMSAFVEDARHQGFTVVPLDKPGCFLTEITNDRPGWPCASWFRWAVAQDHKLHPVATVVSFEMTAGMQAHSAATSSELRAVLGQVANGVLLADPPGQSQQPGDCIARPGATMRRCSSRVLRTYVPLMHALGRMTRATHHPAIPTLQWFCANTICPMVINHTLTLRDRSHFTLQYSTDLGPVLGLELKPIMIQLERRSLSR